VAARFLINAVVFALRGTNYRKEKYKSKSVQDEQPVFWINSLVWQFLLSQQSRCLLCSGHLGPSSTAVESWLLPILFKSCTHQEINVILNFILKLQLCIELTFGAVVPVVVPEWSIYQFCFYKEACQDAVGLF